MQHSSYDTGMPPYDLEVVVPAFNKADEIAAALARICDTLRSNGLAFRVHVVFDGPDPIAVGRVVEADMLEVSIHQLPIQSGKGSAVRYGFVQTISEFVAYIDGDLDLDPISLFEGYKVLLKSTDRRLACVYGSKFHEGSTVNYPLIRRSLSLGYRAFIRVLFGFGIDDTQTGLKLYKRAALLDALKNSQEDRFLFDLEIFVLLKKSGCNFVSIPVNLQYNYTSTIGLSSIRVMFRDTMKLFWKISRKRFSRSVE